MTILKYITLEGLKRIRDITHNRGGSMSVEDANKLIKAPWKEIAEGSDVYVCDIDKLLQSVEAPSEPDTLHRLLMKANQHVKRSD